MGLTTSTGYNDLGLPVSTSNLGGTLGYSYNSDDQIAQMTLNGDVVATPSYDSLSRMAGVSYPSGTGKAGNGTSGVFAFDDRGLPASVTWSGPSSDLITSDAVTSRDQLGRIVNQAVDGFDPNGVTPNYVYDSVGRLVSAVTFAAAPAPGAAVRATSYGFTGTACGVAAAAGRNGNRVTKTVDSVPVTYCYDHADRLTATSDPAAAGVNTAAGSLSYDSRGNTARLDEELHVYDGADRHIATMAYDSLTEPGPPPPSDVTLVIYTRDAADRIVGRRQGDEMTAYGHSGNSDSPQVIFDDNLNVTQVTIGLPGGGVLHVDPAAMPRWSYPNLQGSIAAQADNVGTKIGGTFIYDPDGIPASGGLPDTRPGDFDDTWMGGHSKPLEHAPGLQPVIEMGARQYHPVLARFLEPDPIEAGTDNDYTYPTDPINQTDLTGTCGLGNPFKACGPDHKGPTNIFSGSVDYTRRNSGTIVAVTMTSMFVGTCALATGATAGAALVICGATGAAVGGTLGWGVGIATAPRDVRKQPSYVWNLGARSYTASACSLVLKRGCGKAAKVIVK